jgi:putative transcriptional regulator
VSISSIEPGLLLAAPSLGDPNFEGTVVLLGIHDEESGSLGWIVNGPPIAPGETIVRATGLVSATDLLPDSFKRPARRGGPVAEDSVAILYDRRDGVEALPGSIPIGEQIAVTATAEALRILLAGDGPSEFHLLVGYAGWAPGQLTREMSLGAWLPAAANARLLFGDELGSLWRRAYAEAIGNVPTAFVGTRRGSA